MANSSIIHTNYDKCYLCGGYPTDWHHVFEGANRQMSEEYGLKIKLCRDCHRKLHEPKNETERRNAKILKQGVQKYAMKHYKWTMADWLSHFTKNYLEE